MERPLHDHFLFFDVSGSIVQPNVAESWTVNDDSTEFTFTLRKGHKWSDGAPLTTDDIMFWYEKIQGNDELVPNKPAWMNPGGESAAIREGRRPDFQGNLRRTVRFLRDSLWRL